jgi:hypothetical protein
MSDQGPLMRSLRAVRESHPAVGIVMSVACRESRTHQLFLQNMRELGGTLQELSSDCELDPLYGRVPVKIYQVCESDSS